jgi:peptide/nickel transport system substrate-binding protein
MNGRPVTAQDVVWSFERFMKLSPQKSTFDQVADVTAPDARTVRFQLKDVFVPFEAALGAPLFWIMPREVIEQDGDASKRVIGSGPFIFDSTSPAFRSRLRKTRTTTAKVSRTSTRWLD